MGWHEGHLYKVLVPNRLEWYPAAGSGYPGTPPDNPMAGWAEVGENRWFQSTDMQAGKYKIWITYAYCSNIPGEWAQMPDNAEIDLPPVGPIKQFVRSPTPEVECEPKVGEIGPNTEPPEEEQ